MKTFTELRNKKLTGKVVFDKRIRRVPVKIVKGAKGFTAYVDGDKLDTYRSEREAKRSTETAIKELT